MKTARQLRNISKKNIRPKVEINLGVKPIIESCIQLANMGFTFNCLDGFICEGARIKLISLGYKICYFNSNTIISW